MAFHRESGQDLAPVSSRPIQCPNCSNAVPAANINISALLAKCDLCGHVIQLADAGGPAAVVEQRPSGIIEEADPEAEVSLSYRWFEPGYIAFLFFCIFWDGFLIFATAIALFGSKRPDDSTWAWGMIPFYAFGGGLTYVVVAGFVNRTAIRVIGGQLVVRHGPVRWWGERCLLISDLLEIELDRANTEDGQDLMVSVHHRDGRQIVLLSARPERQAKYIAQRLASHLRLPLRVNYVEREKWSPLNVKEAFKQLMQKRPEPRGSEQVEGVTSLSSDLH